MLATAAYDHEGLPPLLPGQNDVHHTAVNTADYGMGIPPLSKTEDIMGDHGDSFSNQHQRITNPFDSLLEGSLQNELLGSVHANLYTSEAGQTESSHQTSGTSNYHNGGQYFSSFPYDQGRNNIALTTSSSNMNPSSNMNQASAPQYAEAANQVVMPTSPCPAPNMNSGMFQQRLNDHNTHNTGSGNGVGNPGQGSRPDDYLNPKLEYQFQTQYGQFQEYPDLSQGVQASNYFNQYYQQQQGWGEQRAIENNMQAGYYPPPHPDYHNINNTYSHLEGTNKRGFSDESAHTSADTGIQRRKPAKKRVKRSDDMPRYPLSAYNFFFSEEREVALALLSASVNDLEEYEHDDIIPDAVPCSSEDSSDSSITASSERSMFTNEFPTFENQQEEFDYISRVLSCRKMCKAKHEELRARIEANTDKKLNTLYEGDKVKKSHKKSHGKITFQVLSRLIGQRWRDISDAEVKQRYFDLAKKDQERYNFHMKEYKQKK